NSVQLVELVTSEAALGHDMGICPDEEVSLSMAIRRALTADVALLSGGVSAGVVDLVPRALADEGVEPVFHHVRLKPGRPLFYGTHGKKHVFGMPGNPVSVFAGFELFVRPLLRRLMGVEPAIPHRLWVLWDGPPLGPNARTRALGVRLSGERPPWKAAPVPSRGSADVAALSRFDALALAPADKPVAPGDLLEAIPLRLR
ncbi:MAG: molybdopterin-binding protein, partial [Pirellulales bacterium]